MNHFEHSMAIRRQIMDDQPLMKKLAKHFMDCGKLQEVIGSGTNNIHYRAGKLPGGLWVATREQFDEPIPYDSVDKGPDWVLAGMRRTGMAKPAELEVFCREAYGWTEYGGFNKENLSITDFASNGGVGYATSFSIIVRFNNPLRSEKPLYALLVEDLTNGGEYKISKSQDMDWVGQIPGRSGQIQIDLDDMPRWRKMHGSIPHYMEERSIIVLS